MWSVNEKKWYFTVDNEILMKHRLFGIIANIRSLYLTRNRIKKVAQGLLIASWRGILWATFLSFIDSLNENSSIRTRSKKNFL